MPGTADSKSKPATAKINLDETFITVKKVIFLMIVCIYWCKLDSPGRSRTDVPGTKTRDDGPLHYRTVAACRGGFTSS